MKTYKIRKDLSIQYAGRTLYRIEALEDMPNHYVKKGDIGGWIEKEENLQDGAWIGGDAKVFGNAVVRSHALVCGSAVVRDNAEVCGDAEVRDLAVVSGCALVHGCAVVFGRAKVRGYADIGDNAVVFGKAIIEGHACLFNVVTVGKNAKVQGHAAVRGLSNVFGDVIEKTADVLNIVSEEYNITITPLHIKIGCQYHSKKAWFNFTDNEIKKMDGKKALEWWKKWKPILKNICEVKKGIRKNEQIAE